MIDFHALYSLCNKNEWFTGGTNTQHEKLFDLRAEGATLDELALVIWLCSDTDKWTREAIRAELEAAASI